MNEEDTVRAVMREMGRRGGLARAKKLGSEEVRAAAKRASVAAAEKRRADRERPA